MIEITKWPVLIFSNYRTGSTVLGDFFVARYGCDYLDEPINSNPGISDEEKYKILHEYHDCRCVIKFMGDHTIRDSFYKDLLEINAFKIKLYRTNKIDQITSFYISQITNRWFRSKNEIIEDYEVLINLDILIRSVDFILYNDSILDNSLVNFDIITNYESLGFIDNVDSSLTKSPNNIDYLKELIKDLLLKRQK